ncbi:MAG: GAP family protein [Pseudonocardia sp.]|nr:GAP family protein [Pseudonocardia sp.]
MSTEALVLAVASVLRPTALVAVWAMLVGTRPLRPLSAYLLAGLAFSLTTGIAVVVLLGDTLSPRSPGPARGLVAIALGVASLLAAVAAGAGWLRRSRPSVGEPARGPRRLSTAGAAVAGVLTHLPGVFYLAALSAIVTTSGSAGEEVQVVVYNLVWFAPAIAALALCLLGAAPSAARLDGIVARGRRFETQILVVGFGALGVWLVAKGIAVLSS